jgi:hypothetical protein
MLAESFCSWTAERLASVSAPSVESMLDNSGNTPLEMQLKRDALLLVEECRAEIDGALETGTGVGFIMRNETRCLVKGTHLVKINGRVWKSHDKQGFVLHDNAIAIFNKKNTKEILITKINFAMTRRRVALNSSGFDVVFTMAAIKADELATGGDEWTLAVLDCWVSTLERAYGAVVALSEKSTECAEKMLLQGMLDERRVQQAPGVATTIHLPEFSPRLRVLYSKLDASQQQAVNDLYSGVWNACEDKGFTSHLWWGPPGTGKTTTLTVATLALVEHESTGGTGDIVYAVAPTNMAVNVLAANVLTQYVAPGLHYGNGTEQRNGGTATRYGAEADGKGCSTEPEDGRMEEEVRVKVEGAVRVKVEGESTQSQVMRMDGSTLSTPADDSGGPEGVAPHQGAASLKLRDVVVVGREERVILIGEVKALHLDWRAGFLLKLWYLVAKKWGADVSELLYLYPLDEEPADAKIYNPQGGIPGTASTTAPTSDVRWLRYAAPATLRQLVDGYILGRTRAGGQRKMFLTRLQAVEWLKELIPSALSVALEPFLESEDFASKRQLDRAFRSSQECSNAILYSARLVLSTVSVSGRQSMQNLLATRVKAIVCDEAAMIPRSIFSILLTGNARFVLQVGDHKQLGAVVKSRAGSELKYGRSLFEDHILLGMPQSMLLVQRRSVGDIVQFNNTQFYGGKLKHDVKHRQDINTAVNAHVPPLTVWLSSKDLEELQGNSYNSKLQSQICLELLEQCGEVCAGLRVVVLTFYENQRSTFLENLRSYQNRYKQSALNGNYYKSIEAKTVHQFQGNEADIIVLLTTRCNTSGDAGFCGDARLFNVATTRAGSALFVIGCEATLSTCEVWRAFFAHCRADTTGSVRVAVLDPPTPSTGTSAASADRTTEDACQADLQQPPASSSVHVPPTPYTGTSAARAGGPAAPTSLWDTLTAAAQAVVEKYNPNKEKHRGPKSVARNMVKQNHRWGDGLLRGQHGGAAPSGDGSENRKRARSSDSEDRRTASGASRADTSGACGRSENISYVNQESRNRIPAYNSYQAVAPQRDDTRDGDGGGQYGGRGRGGFSGSGGGRQGSYGGGLNGGVGQASYAGYGGAGGGYDSVRTDAPPRGASSLLGGYGDRRLDHAGSGARYGVGVAGRSQSGNGAAHGGRFTQRGGRGSGHW